MHRSILAIAASTALIFGTPAFAQRGHGGGKPTTHGNSGATTHGQGGSHAPVAHGGGKTTTHGSGATKTHVGGSATHASGATKTHGGGSTKTATTTKTARAKADSKKTATTTTADATTSTSVKTTTTADGSTVTLTNVQQKLQKNTNLADKLTSRLPAGTDLMKAAEGFKNLGQFVAAVNVSNNLGLKFTDLKTRMVEDGMSLGQAIQDVKKTANVQTEVAKATTEADAMIKSSETSTTTSTTTTTASKKSSKTKTKSLSTEDK